MATDFLSGLVPTIEVRTALTPPIDVSTAGVSGGGPSPLVKFLKPAVVAYDVNGNVLTTIAPYGDASPAERTTKMLMLAGGVVLVLAVAFMLGRASA